MTKEQYELKKLETDAQVVEFFKNLNLVWRSYEMSMFNSISKKVRLTKVASGWGSKGTYYDDRYYLAEINGVIHMARVSTTWGEFVSPDCCPYVWDLEGGKRKKDGTYKNVSQVGVYVLFQ